jgi:hypothetical protein
MEIGDDHRRFFRPKKSARQIRPQNGSGERKCDCGAHAGVNLSVDCVLRQDGFSAARHDIHTKFKRPF